jgi:hypothetical protein
MQAQQTDVQGRCAREMEARGSILVSRSKLTAAT